MTINKLYLVTPEAVVPFPTGISTIMQVRFFQSAWRAVCSSWANFSTYHLRLACCSTVTIVPCLTCCAFRGTRTLWKQWVIKSILLHRPKCSNIVVVSSGQCTQLNLASSQTCHLNKKINLTWYAFKSILVGGRSVSYLQAWPRSWPRFWPHRVYRETTPAKCSGWTWTSDLQISSPAP